MEDAFIDGWLEMQYEDRYENDLEKFELNQLALDRDYDEYYDRSEEDEYEDYYAAYDSDEYDDI